MEWDFGYDGGAGQLWFDRIVACILWWKFIRDLHKIMAQDYHTNWSPWHHRMVHILPEAVRHLVSEREIGWIEIDESTQLQACDSCEYANATQKPIRKIHKTPRASEFGE